MNLNKEAIIKKYELEIEKITHDSVVSTIETQKQTLKKIENILDDNDKYQELYLYFMNLSVHLAVGAIGPMFQHLADRIDDNSEKTEDDLLDEIMELIKKSVVMKLNNIRKEKYNAS